MPSIKEIKNRTKSVKNTQQITKAMNLVSAAKLQKSKTKLEHYREFYNNIISIMSSIVRHTNGINNDFLKIREVKNSLYIVVTSDRGLCGGYNSNIIKTLISESNNKNIKIITIGKKIKSAFRKKDFDVISSIEGHSENPEYSVVREIASKAMKMYESGEIDEVKVLYTYFKTTLVQEVKIDTILPLTREQLEIECTTDENVLHSYEPSAEFVLNRIIPQYFEGYLYGTLLEAATSEQGARMNAMDTATENAGDLISKLTLLYNRKRQAAITQEIAEVVGGAEALN